MGTTALSIKLLTLVRYWRTLKGMRIASRETRRFSEKLAQIATDDEYQTLQNELEANPEKGDVIQGAEGKR